MSFIVYLFTFAVAGLFLNQSGTLTAVSVGLFVLSLAYWFAVPFISVQALVTSYVAMYGGVAVRTWV